MRKIWLTRHGESEYNQRALLGGDSSISPSGQIYARLLPDVIVDRIPLVRHPHIPFFLGFMLSTAPVDQLLIVSL